MEIRCVLEDGGVDPGVTGVLLDRLQRDPDVHVTSLAGAEGARCVVRLRGDGPLVDADLVRAAVVEHLRSGADYTSNTLIRTFPRGLDVEVFSSVDLLRTPDLVRTTSRFRLRQLRTPERLGHLDWRARSLDSLHALVGDHPSRRLLGWRAILGELELRDRRPLMDGFEPATAADLPPGIVNDPSDFGDPSRHLLVHRTDGRADGWLDLQLHDGIATVRGDLGGAPLAAAQRQFDDFVAASPQIVGGELSLRDVEHALESNAGPF